ncbi:MAG TPA: MBL fold metallo-hydrolase [bacterium]|nr:MBL fold metallo-hydrolase [bacterium]
MARFVCVTCGTQYPEAERAPAACPICEDERQFVGWEGQRWTTLEAMRADGHRNVLAEEEPGLTSFLTVPRFAIGQRALLVRTPGGNLLWDCITYLDRPTVDALRALGGIAAIAISHPHYYSAMVEWSDAFGGAPVYLHAADRRWVMHPSPRIVFWTGEVACPLPGVELINLGGHFDGGTVLHWPAGAEGRGVLLSGDIIQVVQDRRSVSFMYSYPNLIPLGGEDVARIAAAIRRYRFDRIYGAFDGRQIPAGAGEAVERCARRYIERLTGPPRGAAGGRSAPAAPGEG